MDSSGLWVDGSFYTMSMDPAIQEQFRSIILQRLDDIHTELNAAEESTGVISPDKSIGRLSRLDSMQMQQMALASKRRLEAERQRLKQALSRLDGGKYGDCAVCGQPIASERLEYQPDAETCVPCLEKASRR